MTSKQLNMTPDVILAVDATAISSNGCCFAPAIRIASSARRLCSHAVGESMRDCPDHPRCCRFLLFDQIVGYLGYSIRYSLMHFPTNS